MSQFIKGQPRHPGAGRQKGSKNKKKIAKVADLLAEKDINPVERILAIIPTLEPQDQVKSWLDLLSYCEAKPKAIEMPVGGDDEDLEDFEDVSNEDLLKIVRPPSGVA